VGVVDQIASNENEVRLESPHKFLKMGPQVLLETSPTMNVRQMQDANRVERWSGN
jgi:hypothetical protein